MLDEMERVITLLSKQPDIGRIYTRGGTKDVRWVRLRGMPSKAYYHYASGDNVVSILSVWSGVRKHGPPLRNR